MRRNIFLGDAAFGSAFAFVAGVFMEGIEWPARIFVSAGAIAAIATSLHWPFLRRSFFIFFLAFLCGTLYCAHYRIARSTALDLPFDVPSSFAAVIKEEPKPTEKGILLQADLQTPHRGKLTLFVISGKYRYGDLISVSGTISRSESGGGGIVFSPSLEKIAAHRGSIVRESLIAFKERILSVFVNALPEEQAALLGGITFGSKASFTKDLREAMARSGTTHLVAVSGYNITVVIIAVGGVFGKLFSRRTTFALSVAFVVLFVLMVGTEASAVRAAIMGGLALLGRELGRKFNMRNAITFTAAGMSFADPLAPAGDMSFILSFLSLLGIVYVGPPIRAAIGGVQISGIFDWKENAITTISAQLAVLPALVHAFGRFSPVAIAANVMILATVPLTMFFGALLAIAGSFSPLFAFLPGKLTGIFLGYQLSMIRFFSSVAIPLPIAFNSAFFMALYYAALLIFIIKHRDA